MHVESEVLINASPGVVFAYVSNVMHEAEWQEAAVWTKPREPGPVKLGSEFDHEGRFLGMRVRSAGSVTVYEPDRRFGYDFSSTFGQAAMRYELEPGGPATRLRLSTDSPLPLFLRPFAALMARSVQGMFDRDVIRLRDAVERSAAG